ncbi:hypothetical protein SNEBB_004810 [Seison nebaliae]|nr:hypothetical protein SNEBB_004810 [Seison nebaliae]
MSQIDHLTGLSKGKKRRPENLLPKDNIKLTKQDKADLSNQRTLFSGYRKHDTFATREVRKNIKKELVSNSTIWVILFNYVECKTFKVVILGSIIFNVLLILAQSFESINTRFNYYFQLLNVILLVIFTWEIIFKLLVHRVHFFYRDIPQDSSIEKMNLVDLTVAIMSLVSYIIEQYLSIYPPVQTVRIIRMFRLIKALRSIRALKIVKTFRFFSSLQQVLTTLVTSLDTLSGIIITINLTIYVYAMCGYEIFHEADPENFGTLFKTFVTLLKVLTVDDWIIIWRRNHSNPGLIFYLITYIFLEYFILLNVLVALLIDNFSGTVKQIETEKEINQNRQIRNLEDQIPYSFNRIRNIQDRTVCEDDLSRIGLRTGRLKMDEVFPHVPKRERDLLKKHFNLMTSLEYYHDLFKNIQYHITHSLMNVKSDEDVRSAMVY